MVVEALRHEVGGQAGRLVAARLLDLGALVLEPNLDLGLVEAEVAGQVLAPLLRQVLVLLELLLEAGQLLGGEGGAGALLLGVAVAALDAAGAGTWGRKGGLVAVLGGLCTFSQLPTQSYI